MDLAAGKDMGYADILLRIWHCVNDARIRPQMYVGPSCSNRDLFFWLQGLALGIEVVSPGSALQDSFLVRVKRTPSSSLTTDIPAHSLWRAFDEWLASLFGAAIISRHQYLVDALPNTLNHRGNNMLLDVFDGAGLETGRTWLVALEFASPLDSKDPIQRRMLAWSAEKADLLSRKLQEVRQESHSESSGA